MNNIKGQLNKVEERVIKDHVYIYDEERRSTNRKVYHLFVYNCDFPGREYAGVFASKSLAIKSALWIYGSDDQYSAALRSLGLNTREHVNQELRRALPLRQEQTLLSARVTRKSAPASNGLNPSAADIAQFVKIEPYNGRFQMTVIRSWQSLGPQHVGRFDTYDQALVAARRIYCAKHHLSAIEAIGSAMKSMKR